MADNLGPTEIIVENGDYLGFADMTPDALGLTMTYLANKYGAGASYTIRPWTAIRRAEFEALGDALIRAKSTE